MEAVIWSFLGENEITTIVYDYWAVLWANDLKKLKLKIDLRYSLDGKIPSLENIPKVNDVLFVWTGTSTGMSVNNCDFIKDRQEGLVISDITSEYLSMIFHGENLMYQYFHGKRHLVENHSMEW